MTDKIYTDEKIIHDLNCYENLGYRSCGYAIDLINRQKAEIAWLRDTITGYEKMEEELHENHKTISKSLDDIARMIPVHDQKVRAEAIEEFAERLKETMTTQTTDNINEPCVNIIYYADETIDQIAKELTEGKQ